MATMQDLSKAQLAFQVAGGEPDEFLVQRFRGSEGLCQLYRFEIDLVTTLEDIEFDTIVGKPATLSVNTFKGTRWFHGIVSQLEMTGGTPGQDYYRAELVPAAWLLTQRYNSRIWQNKTVPEIVSDVLTQAGIPSDRVKKSLTGSHPAREYCVQYRETDYNLMCRLLEEEGIWWCFEQAQEGHFLVLADSVSAYTPLPGEDDKLPFVPPSGMNTEHEHVFRFRIGQSVRPGAVTLNDFNFEDPKLKLEAKSNAGRDAGFEFYDYPGEYNAGSRGGQLAKTRMEEFESARILGFGQSNSYRMAPSRVFEMIEHPSTPLNKKYLLTKVRHEGKEATTRTVGGGSTRSNLLQARVHELLIQARQNDNETIKALAEGILEISMRLGNGDRSAHRDMTSWLYHAGQVSRDLASTAAASGGHPLEPLALPNLIDDVARAAMVDYDAPVYECTFECIPSEVIYRPARVTPWPVMRGSQTARVVGPDGEEIYCDKYGRVKVQFHWDRIGKFDDKSSCWIRVSQGMAGGQYGMMFLPRVGQEVVVDFLEGDPDQPLITGRVFNGDHMPPYDLPKEKTKSVIRTRSSKGGGGNNEIRFEDLKGKEEIFVHAQKDLHVRVKHDNKVSIENDSHLTVDKNKHELIKQSASNEVKKDLSENIGGKKSLKVTGDVGEDFGGNHSTHVGRNHYLKADQGIVLDAGLSLTIKVGGNCVKIDPSGVTIVGTTVRINSGGGAGSGSLVGLTAPTAPAAAPTGLNGTDTDYTGGETPEKAEKVGGIKGALLGVGKALAEEAFGNPDKPIKFVYKLMERCDDVDKLRFMRVLRSAKSGLLHVQGAGIKGTFKWHTLAGKLIKNGAKRQAILGGIIDFAQEGLDQIKAGKFQPSRLAAKGLTGAGKSWLAYAAGAAATAALAATAPGWIPVAAGIGAGIIVGCALDWVDKKLGITDKAASLLSSAGNAAVAAGKAGVKALSNAADNAKQAIGKATVEATKAGMKAMAHVADKARQAIGGTAQNLANFWKGFMKR